MAAFGCIAETPIASTFAPQRSTVAPRRRQRPPIAVMPVFARAGS